MKQMKKLSPQQKAGNTLKGRNRQKKAHKTAREALKCAKAALRRKEYRASDFLSKQGYEHYGVVDLVAVKKDVIKRKGKKDYDNLKIIFLQVKGGKDNKTSEDEKRRLRLAVGKAKVYWDYYEKHGKSGKFGRNIE